MGALAARSLCEALIPYRRETGSAQAERFVHRLLSIRDVAAGDGCYVHGFSSPLRLGHGPHRRDGDQSPVTVDLGSTAVDHGPGKVVEPDRNGRGINFAKRLVVLGTVGTEKVRAYPLQLETTQLGT